MPKLAAGLGLILILLGLAAYAGSGAASWTALIPTLFGVPLAALGWLARAERFRMHAMHAAAALALLGLIGTVRGLFKLPALLTGGDLPRPAAVWVQSIMAVLCLVFLVLCVKSFVDARRARGGTS